MLNLWKDFRYALRQLRSAPVFALTAVLTLGLGLGGTATMYRVVHDVLLAPLPYPSPKQLVGIAFTFPHEKPNAEQMGSTADFLAHHSRSFASVGVADDENGGVNLAFPHGAGVPEQVHARRISAGFLPTLGVAPLLGHLFTQEEDLPNGPHAALLSYNLWRRSFGADRSLVGRAIQIDGEPYTVAGVLPAGFSEPGTPMRAGLGAVATTDLWVPLQLSPKDPGYDGDNFMMVGRLRPGVTPAAAQAEISTFTEPFYREHPGYRRWTQEAKLLHEYRVWPLADVVTSVVRLSLLAMMAAVAAVLLIACLNLAGVTATRAAQRGSELAIRRALGASAWSLLRLLMAEGLLLSLAGAGLAFAFEQIAAPAVLHAAPLALPLFGTTHAWQFALFLAPAAAVACSLFSLWPALHAVARPAASAMPGRGTAGADRSGARLGKTLVVAQVALATLLLSGASVLLGAFLKLEATPPGFAPQQLVAAQVNLKGAAYQTTLPTTQFLDKVLSRLEHVPGVWGVAAVDGLPLDRGLNIGMRPDDRHELQGIAEYRPATPGYFRTLGLHLLAGRGLLPSDTPHTPAVAVVSQEAAKRWWPGRSPIGRHVSFAGDEPMTMEVVGVVSDVHSHSLAEPQNVVIYEPYAQMPDAITKMNHGWFATSFLVRTSKNVPMERAIEQAIHEADPGMPVAKIATMQAVIDDTVAAPRFFSGLTTAFAGFALLLTAIGLFGLLSYQVAQREREFGIRIAVGATREHILLSVVRRGLLLTALGLVLGLTASLAVPRLVSSLLADIVYTGDAPAATLLAGSSLAQLIAALVLLFAALAACSLPAYRASRIDPMQALRSE